MIEFIPWFIIALIIWAALWWLIVKAIDLFIAKFGR